MASSIQAGEVSTDAAGPRGDAGLVDLLKVLIAEAGALARSEADVMKLEVQESTKAMIIDAIKTAIYGSIALLGALSLMTFLIIALGQMFGGSRPSGYWLSALIIGVVFAMGGGFMATRHARRIGGRVNLPNTKGAIHSDKQFTHAGLSRFKRIANP